MIPLKDDNPTSLRPVVSYVIFGACILVYLWEMSLGKAGGAAAINALGVVPRDLLSGEMSEGGVPPVITVFSSMFLHGGLMHLGFNMLYLWIFADNVEDSMGHGRFVLFYLICGIAATLAHALPSPSSDIPMIGASGAISGVLGAYLLLYPHARVYVVIPILFIIRTFWMPAGWVLLIWFGLQLLFQFIRLGGNGGGVAYGAHIGGFVAGMILIPFFKRRDVPLFHPLRRH